MPPPPAAPRGYAPPRLSPPTPRAHGHPRSPHPAPVAHTPPRRRGLHARPRGLPARVHGLPDAFVAALCASSAACLRASAPCLTPLPDRLHEAKVPVPVQNVKIVALGLALPYRLFFTGAQWYTSPHAR